MNDPQKIDFLSNGLKVYQGRTRLLHVLHVFLVFVTVLIVMICFYQALYNWLVVLVVDCSKLFNKNNHPFHKGFLGYYHQP